MKLIHRAVLTAMLLILSAAVAAGCGDDDGESSGDSGAASGGGKSLSVAIQDDWNNLPIEVARREGFFKKHGVSEVKFVKFTALPALTAAVSRGQVDIGFQTPIILNTFNKTSKAAKFKFFASGVRPTTIWLARKGSGIPPTSGENWQDTVKTWRGKTVGVPALGGLVEHLTRYLIKQAGLDPEKDTAIVAAGLGPALGAALKSGKVDLVAGDGFGAEAILQSGQGNGVLDLTQQQGPEILATGTFFAAYFAPEDRIQKDRATYAGFARAIEEAKAFLKDPANTDRVKQILGEYLTAAPKVRDGLLNRLEIFDADLSRTTMDRTIKAWTEIGSLPAPAPTFDDLVADVKGA